MSYSEKLRDKRWLKRRYEILLRDNHTCQLCGYIGSRVNVHHLKYTGEPWDAPDCDLITLCRYCHKTHHTPEINDKKYDLMSIKHIIGKCLRDS